MRGIGQWRGVVWPISLGGLAVAIAIFLMREGVSLTDRAFAGSFIALSVLTVPHMLVPLLSRWLGRRDTPHR